MARKSMGILWLVVIISWMFMGCSLMKTAEKKELDVFVKDDFQLQIHSDQISYTLDEKIDFWATLEYLGEAEEVTIGHGSHYLQFAIEQIDGDLQFAGGVDFFYSSTKLEQGTEYVTKYTKRGGYTSDDPNAKVYEEFYSKSDVYLPVGEYKITASASFECIEIDGIEIDPIEYKLPTEIEIKVVEQPIVHSEQI